jgi:hypothetical protein
MRVLPGQLLSGAKTQPSSFDRLPSQFFARNIFLMIASRLLAIPSVRSDSAPDYVRRQIGNLPHMNTDGQCA